MFAEKRKIVSIFIIAALVLFPVSFYGQEPSGTNQTTANSPPVAQPLVPEGELAIQLARDLKIINTQNEAQAEDMLGAIGVEPKNGWIADYPVTPDIVGEIQKSVAAAVDAQKLKMGKDQAQRAVENVVARLGLNVMPGSSSPYVAAAPFGGSANTTIYQYIDENGVTHFTDRYESIPEEYRNQFTTIQGGAQPQSSAEPAAEGAVTQVNNLSPNPSPEVINNYYYNEGPPVVTYYPPPEPYDYLYVWVPYPFWCSGFFFSGFFILHDFHRQVVFHNRIFVVTNHIVDRRNKNVFLIDPVRRVSGRSIAINRVNSFQGFRSPAAQASARRIVALNQQRVAFRNGPGFSNVAPPISENGIQAQTRSSNQDPNTRRTTSAVVNRRSTTNSAGSVVKAIRPSTGESSRSSQPENRNMMKFGQPRAGGPRTFNPPAPRARSFSEALRGQGFRSPSAPQHSPSFSTHSNGGRVSFGGFHGGSGFAGHIGSFGGGFGGRR